ncbi:MAG TPA: hypothetical protein DD729_01420 [Rhodobacteraceae bacterium]|jgi:hypothetical protein|nr:hypothetical protein [Paracoccaceae bacterium]
MLIVGRETEINGKLEMTDEVLINQINNAIGAHGSWKIKLRTAVNKGKSEHSVDDVRCDDKCPFGKWLHGSDIDSETRSSVPYNVIKRLHAEFHVCAADVLTKAISGETAAATQALEGDFAAKSEKLVRGLRKWKGEAAAS